MVIFLRDDQLYFPKLGQISCVFLDTAWRILQLIWPIRQALRKYFLWGDATYFLESDTQYFDGDLTLRMISSIFPNFEINTLGVSRAHRKVCNIF